MQKTLDDWRLFGQFFVDTFDLLIKIINDISANGFTIQVVIIQLCNA